MIRRLKILISHKERELRSTHPNTRERVRLELKALKIALAIAIQNRDDKRKSAA